ncbi:hypothetical protein BJX99DRAFT_242081 [Aspergillus californicus]
MVEEAAWFYSPPTAVNSQVHIVLCLVASVITAMSKRRAAMTVASVNAAMLRLKVDRITLY